MIKPARWECPTQEDADVMEAWVNTELDRIDASIERYKSYATMLEKDKWRSDGETPDWAIAMMNVEKSMKMADENGNIEPLRQDLEYLTGFDLARFLRRPIKEKRGAKFLKDDSNDRAKKAARDVRHIQALWQREFPGHDRRPKGDFISAVAIAAKRNDVDFVAVVSKRKNPARLRRSR